LIFAVLERWILQQKKQTDSIFVFIIFAVLLDKTESVPKFPLHQLNTLLQRVHEKTAPKYNGLVFEIFGKHH